MMVIIAANKFTQPWTWDFRSKWTQEISKDDSRVDKLSSSQLIPA